MRSPVIEVEELVYTYHPGTPFEVRALDGVSLEVFEGEILAVAGVSGSGKSTLVQHFNGILLPASGRVRVFGEDTRQKGALVRLWQTVGLVFQQPEHQLFGETVREDVAFGPRNLGLGPAEVEERVAEALRLVGLEPAAVAGLPPYSLSGGWRRLVAVAGVLAVRPKVLVLDEPAAGLDPAGRRRLLGLLESLRRERGTTVVVVSHDLEEVARLADRVAVLAQGRIAAVGSPREVFLKAAELRAAGLEAPLPVRLLNRLKAAGLPVRGTALTAEEAECEIAGAFCG